MIQFKNRHVRVFESALFRTTCSVIQTEDLVLVVDPNWLPMEIEIIKNYVDELIDESPKRELLLLFTHSDYDHILGYGAFPQAKVFASSHFVQNKDKGEVLKQITDWDDEYYIQRDYIIQYPQIDFLVTEDGQEFSIGDTSIHCYFAPGHTRDSLFTTVEMSDTKGGDYCIFLAGDYLSNVEFPFIYDSSEAYNDTLSKVDDLLAKHRINLMIPGHGDAAYTIEEIRNRLELSRSYIRELRSSISSGVDFDLNAWLKLYDFPVSLTKAHLKNTALITQELREKDAK